MPIDRIPYDKFREAYLPLITEYSASNPLISPTRLEGERLSNYKILS